MTCFTKAKLAEKFLNYYGLFAVSLCIIDFFYLAFYAASVLCVSEKQEIFTHYLCLNIVAVLYQFMFGFICFFINEKITARFVSWKYDPADSNDFDRILIDIIYPVLITLFASNIFSTVCIIKDYTIDVIIYGLIIFTSVSVTETVLHYIITDLFYSLRLFKTVINDIKDSI